MTFSPTAEDFSLKYDDLFTFSFFEDEEGYIFSFGHVDPRELIKEVMSYDVLCGSVMDSFLEYRELIFSTIHAWAVISTGELDSEWRFTYGRGINASTEGAFPITVVSR